MTNTTPPQSRTLSAFWSSRREASLNWLALGLLLAAWNASDNEVHNDAGNNANNDAAATVRGRPEILRGANNDAAATVRRRPEALRGYTYVSVRAANRITARSW